MNKIEFWLFKFKFKKQNKALLHFSHFYLKHALGVFLLCTIRKIKLN
jgi:hypothetical protein